MANTTQVKVVLNDAGFKELLNSSEMRNFLSQQASKVQARCGAGYIADTYNAGSRVIASVATSDLESMKDNDANNTLLKALK